MEIIIATNAGFCFGVKRAVDMTVKELNKDENNVYSYGPLIHNPQAVKDLENKGLTTLESFDDIDDGSIIIRAHGVPKATIQSVLDKNLGLVDSTCPYVISVHKKVEDYSNKGYDIVIVGDSSHPEVIGINGWCDNKAYIVNSIEEVSNLPKLDKVCLVSQTTNTFEKFNLISEAVKTKSNSIDIFNTICNATKVRQESAMEVAKQVEAMIVIGGMDSSNTRKLAEISKKYCNNVYHIETIKDLSLQEIQKFNKIGITAGASTPDWIIEEAVRAMDMLNNDEVLENKDEVIQDNTELVENNDENMLNNEEMMQAIEGSFVRIHRGEVIKGTVLYVTNNEVMVNINFRSDGIITRDELSKDPDVKPKDLFKPGDEIQVYVVKLDDGEGNVVLSAKRIDDLKNWDVLEETFKNKTEIDAKVLNVVKGGLIVLVDGVNGFMPASHVSASYVTDLDKFKGKTFKTKIIDFDKDKKRVIVSRKEVEREELSQKRTELWSTLEVGADIVGTVQRLTDFGAFVDLGGVDGLIHISDLSWYRVKHPSEVLKAGEKVEVKVLALDKEKNRISLGLKQTVEEPWEAFKRNVNIGDVVEGKVVNLLEFGAFVRLKEGVDGLLHVSQISKEHVSKPSDVLKIGDMVTVKVIEVNDEDRRISLSAKDAMESEEVVVEAEETIANEELNTTIEDIVNKN